MAATQRRRFPALRHRDFRVLWLGMLMASGTLAFQYYAQMWLIYDITDSAWILGMLGVVRGISTLLFGLYGGALADRIDRRQLLLATRVVQMACTLSLGTLAVLDAAELWSIFLLIFVSGAVGSIDGPVRQALVPELVPPEDIPNAVALNTAVQMGSFAVTPIVAGVVIGLLGPGGAYLISTTGELCILVALYMLHYRGRSTSQRERILTSIAYGFRYARGQPVVLWIIVLNFVVAALAFALFHGPIAKWAADVLLMSPTEYGFLAATWGVGVLAVSYALSYLGDYPNKGHIIVYGSIVFGLTFMLFGLTRSIAIAALWYVLNGAAWACYSIASASVIQSIVPNEVRGRVMSLLMINGAVAQMNALALGLVADTLGMVLMVPLATGLSVLIIVGLIAAVPTVRQLNRRALDAMPAAIRRVSVRVSESR